ncbi:hypothetical protein D3C81_1247600 [compost metagenome]
MMVASSTPAMLCSTAAVQPVRSLPAVQWNSAAPSTVASSLNSWLNSLRIPGLRTKSRLVSCIMAVASAALWNATLVMFAPDVEPPMMSMLVYVAPVGIVSGVAAISLGVRRS